MERPNIETMKRIRKYNDGQINSLELTNLFKYIEYLEKKSKETEELLKEKKSACALYIDYEKSCEALKKRKEELKR